ncbi:pre-rRNA-processing factor esf2 [Babesia ovis]|uniref:Pre-rRNA-processing factor esf2 n=1 Tax=Babesia ovis TaxID=5869 RepID=A0A9W5TDD4_BABOV|nr:pre-rRNA-processing factor esf2 [Babesia ovis]
MAIDTTNRSSGTTIARPERGRLTGSKGPANAAKSRLSVSKNRNKSRTKRNPEDNNFGDQVDVELANIDYVGLVSAKQPNQDHLIPSNVTQSIVTSLVDAPINNYSDTESASAEHDNPNTVIGDGERKGANRKRKSSSKTSVGKGNQPVKKTKNDANNTTEADNTATTSNSATSTTTSTTATSTTISTVDSVNTTTKRKKASSRPNAEAEFAQSSNDVGITDDTDTLDDNLDLPPTSDDVPKDRSGVIFISRIPPFMNVSKIRSYFGKYGKVGKIYAEPESLADYKKRVKMGGNKKLKFVHGWVEFLDKKDAKLVAAHLNGQPVGEKKRHNFWRDDLWNLKYLPRYKFQDVMDYLHQHKSERKEKLSFHLAQSRKENYNYLEQLEAEKHHKEVEARRRKKGLDAYTHKIFIRPKEKKVNKDSESQVPMNLLGAIIS